MIAPLLQVDVMPATCHETIQHFVGIVFLIFNGRYSAIASDSRSTPQEGLVLWKQRMATFQNHTEALASARYNFSDRIKAAMEKLQK